MECAQPQKVIKFCPEVELSEIQYQAFQALMDHLGLDANKLATDIIANDLYGLIEYHMENQTAKRDRLLKLLKAEGY